jgi:hypothetical protein
VASEDAWVKKHFCRIAGRHGKAPDRLLYLQILLHGYAITLTKAVYMISAKRLSILISIVLGRVFFREPQLLVRFSGALLMLCGAFLIALKG